MKIKDLTIGIEEEYQIIDSESRELTSYVTKLLEEGAILFRDQVQPEFLQSQIEVGSHVCRNIKEARQEIRRLRSMVNDIAEKNKRRIVAAGTHPFSSWKDQHVTDKERYKTLEADMSILARRLLIFGMHIHIGIPDRNLRIDIMNQLTYFAPHIFALSTSSPFWRGKFTGLKSYRSVIFEDLPRTGIPGFFQTADDYDNLVQTMLKTKCIEEPTKIWWDLRPHPKFDTIEFRICDCTTKIDEVIALAALVQALVAKLIQLRSHNQTWRRYRRELIAENKWRAMKDGIEGKLLDLGKQEEIPARFLINELTEFVDDVVDELGSREEIEYIQTILHEGTSADRQLNQFQVTESIESVVDMLADETVMGI